VRVKKPMKASTEMETQAQLLVHAPFLLYIIVKIFFGIQKKMYKK
jgi:hypothetical protein